MVTQGASVAATTSSTGWSCRVGAVATDPPDALTATGTATGTGTGTGTGTATGTVATAGPGAADQRCG
ncbi:hypothetical protein GCM10011594_29150 [Nakamurella endophytica]|uniref:Uncharacterized protein n=1 Tax=Nakamurella endophytica TaxID=1748367 RepID=A0A917T1U3_9ACTN|nr:hypothetical protein GCM10011594_29150 [Nakamurella endophytica]